MTYCYDKGDWGIQETTCWSRTLKRASFTKHLKCSLFEEGWKLGSQVWTTENRLTHRHPPSSSIVGPWCEPLEMVHVGPCGQGEGSNLLYSLWPNENHLVCSCWRNTFGECMQVGSPLPCWALEAVHSLLMSSTLPLAGRSHHTFGKFYLGLEKQKF